jgi:hypothetical protein
MMVRRKKNQYGQREKSGNTALDVIERLSPKLPLHLQSNAAAA